MIRKKTTDLNHSYETICGHDDDDNDGNNDSNDDHDDDDDDNENDDEDDDDDDYNVYDAADLQYRLKSWRIVFQTTDKYLIMTTV